MRGRLITALAVASVLPLAPGAASASSPVTLKHLRIGKHTFSVEATDPAGNIDPTPAVFKFRLKR